VIPDNPINRGMVEDEIGYYRRAWGDAQASSRERLVKWAATTPWIRTMVAKAGISAVGRSAPKVVRGRRV
jgi:hypothetical protein